MLAAVLALGPLAALEELADVDTLAPEVGAALVFVIGVAVLGLLDDLLGGRRPAGAAADPDAPRGLRGHARAAARGTFSTGLLKAAGTLGLALYVLSGEGRAAGEYLVGVGLLVLSTHLFNLLDLRPGRAGKVFVAFGVDPDARIVGHLRAARARALHRAGAGAASLRPARARDAR